MNVVATVVFLALLAPPVITYVAVAGLAVVFIIALCRTPRG